MNEHFFKYVIGICLLVPFLACSTAPSFENDDELFQVLDVGLQKWKTVYESADPSIDEMESKLEWITREHRSAIIQALKSGPVEHQIIAAKSLPFLRTDRVVIKSLDRALSGSNQSLQKNALFSLGYIRPDWSKYPDLLSEISKNVRTLARHESPSVRGNAYYAIFGLVTPGNDRGFLDLLKEGLSDSDLPVRNQSVRAFQILRTEQATPLLLQHTLHDNSELVRFNTIQALRNQDDKRAIPELIDLLRNDQLKNPSITNQTVTLLQQLTGRRNLITPEDWVQWYKLEQLVNTRISKSKASSALDRLFSFLIQADRLRPETSYGTRQARQSIRSYLRKVTGLKNVGTLNQWFDRYEQWMEKGTSIPVKQRKAVVPGLLILLQDINNNPPEFADHIVKSLRKISDITNRSQMNTPEEWIEWYRRNQSRFRSNAEREEQKNTGN